MKWTKLILLIIAFNGMSNTSDAQTNVSVNTKQFNLHNQLAIDGYDPVAYFTMHKAVHGKATTQYNFNGVVYYFANSQHAEMFKKAPLNYQPQYGGWCAYAMGNSGEKVEVDPETFKIVDGKLFLFYHSFFNNTLNSWNKDERKLKNKADLNWKKIIQSSNTK